jgi:hypothetical protein
MTLTRQHATGPVVVEMPGMDGLGSAVVITGEKLRRPCFRVIDRGYRPSMTSDISIGDDVEWDWGTGTATGTVTERYTERVTTTIGGAEITRNADDDEPAFLIEQEDGSRVLKSITELRRR